jgi:hypothetical protein
MMHEFINIKFTDQVQRENLFLKKVCTEEHRLCYVSAHDTAQAMRSQCQDNMEEWEERGGGLRWWTQKQCVCTREFIKQYTISGAFVKLRQATVSIVMVRPSASNDSSSTWRFLMKFGIWRFFENLSSEAKFHSNLTGITSTLHENICTLMILFAEYF